MHTLCAIKHFQTRKQYLEIGQFEYRDGSQGSKRGHFRQFVFVYLAKKITTRKKDNNKKDDNKKRQQQ